VKKDNYHYPPELKSHFRVFRRWFKRVYGVDQRLKMFHEGFIDTVDHTRFLESPELKKELGRRKRNSKKRGAKSEGQKFYKFVKSFSPCGWGRERLRIHLRNRGGDVEKMLRLDYGVNARGLPEYGDIAWLFFASDESRNPFPDIDMIHGGVMKSFKEWKASQ